MQHFFEKFSARPLAFLTLFLLALLLAANVDSQATAQTIPSPLTPTVTDTATPTVTPTQKPPTATPTTVIDTIIYIVRPGDTLSSIARRYYTTVNVLMRLNYITDPNRIYVGQRLLVPRPPRPPLPPATPTATPFYPTATATLAATPTPTPAGFIWEAPDGAIEVFSPVADGAYHSPIDVTGFSQTFEGNVVIRLLDAEGNLLAERYAIGGSVDGFDFFHTFLRFHVEERQPATLEVFTVSPQDGSRTDELIIPVLLLPGQRVVDLTAPQVGEAICEPVLVSGYATSDDGGVVVALDARNGITVDLGTALLSGEALYEEFATLIPFPISQPQPLLVSAYALDDGDLRAVDRTRVPITVYPSGSALCESISIGD